MPYFKGHVIALVFGCMVTFVSFLVIALIVGYDKRDPFDTPGMMVILSPFIGLLASAKLFRKLVAGATTTALQISYLCNRQAVIYCLLWMIGLVSFLIRDAARGDWTDNLRFIFIAPFFGLIAVVAWWKMLRVK